MKMPDRKRIETAVAKARELTKKANAIIDSSNEFKNRVRDAQARPESEDPLDELSEISDAARDIQSLDK